MGKKDVITREFLGDNRRFADIWNYFLYDGKEIIRPEDLTDRDTAELIAISDDAIDGQKMIGFEQGYRDLLKFCTVKESKEAVLVLFGVENQSNIHYAMPVRDMLYSAVDYAKQVKRIGAAHGKAKDTQNQDEFLSKFTKEDRIVPVITLVIYWGEKAWDAPRKLSEMFVGSSETLLGKAQDYELNLIVPREIEDFDKFKTSVKQVMEVIKFSKDKKAMQEVIYSDAAFQQVDSETVNVMNTFANLKMKVEKGGVYNMCKAWEDQKNEGIEIGIEQGIEQGIERGIEQGIERGIEQGIEIIIGNMLRKNKSYEDIAEVTELSLDEIKRIEEKLLVTN